MRKEQKMSADLIISSNLIFDSVEEKPYEGYVAIKDEKIMEVGRGKVPDLLKDKNTVEKNYKDKLVMAGFHDSHAHLLMAGMFKSYVNLLNARSEEEAAMMVKKAADADGNKEGWIIGFSWYHVFWDNKTLPTKASLDKYFPDRPVCLINAEAHGAWVKQQGSRDSGNY